MNNQHYFQPKAKLEGEEWIRCSRCNLIEISSHHFSRCDFDLGFEYPTCVSKVVCSWTLTHTNHKFISGNYFSPNISHTVCSPCYHKEMQRIRSQGTPLQKEIERRFNWPLYERAKNADMSNPTRNLIEPNHYQIRFLIGNARYVEVLV